MEFAIILLIFIVAMRRELWELRTYSLRKEQDSLLVRIALGLIIVCMIVGAVDRFVQWLEIQYQPEIFYLDAWLLRIPYNDLSIYFSYNNPHILNAFRAIYNYGFYLPFFGLMLSALGRRDFKMLSLLAFSTFAFHYILHFPFYFLTEGHQIWLVKGIYPPLFRTISPLDHVFPSMHTSISVTYLLLAWKQPNKALRLLYTIFCPLVIFATFYLRIHWTVDAIAGAMVGYAGVRFAVYATSKGWLYSVVNWVRDILGVDPTREYFPTN